MESKFDSRNVICVMHNNFHLICFVIFLLCSTLIMSCSSTNSPPHKEFMELATELPSINTGGYTSFNGPQVKEYEIGFSNFSPKWNKSKDFDNTWKLTLTTEDGHTMVLFFQEAVHDQSNKKIAVLFRVNSDEDVFGSNSGLEQVVHNTIWPVVFSKKK